jgi:FkbM family methyltransferase
MTVETNSVGLQKVLSGEPEHQWERYYQLKPGDIYVEVGANWGRYGMIASGKGCSKIVLIEPSLVNIATIEEVLNTGRIKNAILIKKAISNSKSKSKFCASGNPSAHRLSNNPNDPDLIDVEVDTIDSLLSELKIGHVDLLASDCEGAEIDMVKGANKYFEERRIKNIAIAAYHNPENHKIIIPILKNHGFKALKYEDGVIYGHI